jgi:predicted CXXCH cytochrome family protein
MRTRTWVWLWALALIAPALVHAASVETLLMPGKVSRAHVKQEETCANCHDRSNQTPQRTLCLDCHKDIAADLRDGKGFHGHMPGTGGECRACHTEHKGREADIVHLDPAQFDHGLTDFKLEGAHAGLDCAACHKKGEPWRKVATTCNACHKADDVHRGQLKGSCADCHGTTSWSGGKFDHDKTEFHLTGAHTHVACNACHLQGQYKPTPRSCVGCHATDDVHAGARGNECGKCHTTSEWKTAKFDHLKETGYALEGVHADIDCLACHRSGNYKDKIPKTCAGCHRAEDAHAGRFGGKCEDCHGNDRWQPQGTYDHAGKHHFVLSGAHARLDCHTCHTAPIATQKLAKDCVGCHRHEDPHGGRLQQGCEACHGDVTWHGGLAFDHDLTSFPLLGMHRLTSCAQCHATLTFQGAPTTCVGCHAADDVHKGGLGKKCESCHSVNGWSLWRFDHGKETHFPLLGAHARLACADCHVQPPDLVKLPLTCIGCHRKDDRHLGQYGAQCDHCHSSITWKGARIQ